MGIFSQLAYYHGSCLLENSNYKYSFCSNMHMKIMFVQPQMSNL